MPSATPPDSRPSPTRSSTGPASTTPTSSASAPVSPGAEAARTRRTAWAALVLLVGGPSVGIALALVGGPWRVITVLHLGALAIWFLVWHRGWRDLLRSAGPRSPWLLFAVSAGLCALSAVVHHSIDNPGAVLAPVTPTGLLSALATALGVGVLMNAVPEEFSLRRCLLEPLRAQFGDWCALWTTALAFVIMHLPTWISSHATASTYAIEVPEKLLFGVVAAWSVLRLDSLAFALGMHVGGNFTGVLLSSLSREDTLTGWSRFTTPSVIAILAETLVTAAAVWYLGRP
ncbi:type II CAAX prenyl endopeptidase Rce1 family protein, partial [uncultured Actinomyces sp.]|uniref:CPBP family intramembrane glutamic endopeptidase n=1 Tax=uncultured Actinomyces sp. TaxID=249061 RepID=UPI0028D7C29C